MLIRYLVQADLKRTGADTLLGNLWWLLDPLLQLVVYVILVQVIFQVDAPDYPLFVFSAILPWKWFSTAVNDSILSVTSQDRLIKQIQFPKIVLPIAAVASGVVHFAFGLVPLVGLMVLFYPDRLSPYLLLIPAIAVVQLAFTLPIALACASVNVFFRDLQPCGTSCGSGSIRPVSTAWRGRGGQWTWPRSLLNPWTTHSPTVRSSTARRTAGLRCPTGRAGHLAGDSIGLWR
jgi:ABC-type polysaccharide/polyol phosphate export permease